MWKTPTRAALWSIALVLAAALAACAMPRKARADAAEVPGETYATLGAAIAAGETAIRITGNTPACDVPAGISVAIESGGSITGSFFNNGSVTGASADNCGAIYDYTGAVPSGNVRVQGSAIAGVSEVRFSDGSEAADYQNGVIWIPRGKTIQYLIIHNYVCTPSGGRIQYAIAYLYNNAAQSAMKLDARKYPTAYCVMTVDQTIPAAPDTEVDYVFAGWYCKTLGVDETSLQKAITIPANKGANLTLLSWWTESAGHNEGKSGASTGMSGGMGGGNALRGLAAGVNAMADTLAGNDGGDDDNDDNDENDAATLIDYSAGQGGGTRVRNASSVTRHTFGNMAGDVEARASQRTQKRFPWQWVGIGIGGALTLFAVGLTLRRRLAERNAATLKKLRIRD